MFGFENHIGVTVATIEGGKRIITTNKSLSREGLTT